jgi:hypothetical protein
LTGRVEMKKELTKVLIEQFPLLYRGVDMSIQENLMPFGFECGDGWFSLIYSLSMDLSLKWPDVYAVQVKEKFGTLRFYVGGCSDEAFKRINEAESQSGRTCEICGIPGKLHSTGHWLKTLCLNCAEKEGYVECGDSA